MEIVARNGKTQTSYAIKVSPEDFEALSRYRWAALKNRHGKIYAYRIVNRKAVYMHREIVNAPDGLLVDHFNGDTLDNQRENLKVVTALQNAQNRKSADKDNLTGVRGVTYLKKTGRYRGSVTHAGKRYMKEFKTVQEAGDWAAAKRQELGFHGQA